MMVFSSGAFLTEKCSPTARSLETQAEVRWKILKKQQCPVSVCSISVLQEARSWAGCSHKLFGCRRAHQTSPQPAGQEDTKGITPMVQWELMLSSYSMCCNQNQLTFPWAPSELASVTTQPMAQGRRVKSGQDINCWLQGAVVNKTTEAVTCFPPV